MHRQHAGPRWNVRRGEQQLDGALCRYVQTGQRRPPRGPCTVVRARCRCRGGGGLKNACKLWVIRMPLTAESHEANPNAGLSVSKNLPRRSLRVGECEEKTENTTPTDVAPVPAFPQHPSGALIHKMPVSCLGAFQA